MCLLSSNNPLNFDCYSYDEYFTASSIDFSFYQLIKFIYCFILNFIQISFKFLSKFCDQTSLKDINFWFEQQHCEAYLKMQNNLG